MGALDVPAPAGLDGCLLRFVRDAAVEAAFGFMIGPDRALGIDAYCWTPLYAGTDG
ncbi:hypothetical protein GCM10010271_63310 [Streptomyces kurssanovii]|nr:hypothetical protein GCM10010271_63310 [Streptomyces kurssanovii]